MKSYDKTPDGFEWPLPSQSLKGKWDFVTDKKVHHLNFEEIGIKPTAGEREVAKRSQNVVFALRVRARKAGLELRYKWANEGLWVQAYPKGFNGHA